MLNILVTGGAGYIGSHTCVELLAAGHNLTVIDNFSNAKPEVLDKIRRIAGRDFAFYEGDLRDRGFMERVFAEQPINAVIHFAGFKAVAESIEKPLAYYDNNLVGTLVLLEVMRAANVKRLVFSSSATVYGMDNEPPFREDAPTSATNPYGYTKVMIEQMLRDLAVSDPAWAICMLRYFNPIGAHKSGLIGEDPNGIPNNLAPYVAKVAAGKLPTVHVYGDDYDTPDGTGVRDYIHVVDLALGHLAALAYVSKSAGAKAVNLGTGKGTSVLQIIHAYEKACGHAIAYQIDPRRPGDVAASYADPSLAQRLFGWTATRTIDDMCADSWRFTKANL